MSVPKRSAIWNVFTETHKTDYIATCNICSQELSYRSTTTNLMKHLKRKHPGYNIPSTYIPDKHIEDLHQEVEIVIERQLENECKIESFKVEVKPATEEESPDFIVLGSGKRGSQLWDFFRKIPDSDYMAACNFCDSKLSYKTTITNLKKHLHRKHPEIVKEYSQSQNEFQEQLQHFDCSKDENVVNIENIENNADPPENNTVEGEEDDFWNLQDEPDHEEEFRPSPEPQDEFDSKVSNNCKRRSQIWNVFTEKPGSDYIAFCNVCEQEFCYRSTTNNLKKHFQRKHPGILMDAKIDLVKPEVRLPDENFYERVKNYSSDDEIDDKNEEGKSSRRKPSQIWNFFTKKKLGEYVATCNICKKELGYRSTTSNLKKHLDRKHPEIVLVKSEVEESAKPVPEAPLKTCLICLQTDATEGIEFMQVNSCDNEEKSYMHKIQEIMNQSVVIDESHVLCQPCIIDLEKVLNFKDKILKAFEFWSKIEPEPEQEQSEPVDISADDAHHSDYSDLEDGESLAKFTCSKCHMVFPSPSIMLKHNCDQLKKQKSIQKRVKFVDRDNHYYCHHCGKGFSIKWKLSKHIKRCLNVNSKPFVCSLCNREFKKAYHLREHMASHTGERNYSCNLCGKTFQRSSSKHKHMRSHDAKPGEKSKKTPFLCTICGKNFPYSNGASRHMRVHLGERRHECHICLKRFSQTTHLKVHLRTHSGERPYSCVICSRTFSLNASLRKHMRLHIGSGEFVKLVNNLGANLDTNMEENLGNNISIEADLRDDDMEEKYNLNTTLATDLGVMEHLGNELESDLETNIVHADVVTEDEIHVLTHHDIALEEN